MKPSFGIVNGMNGMNGMLALLLLPGVGGAAPIQWKLNGVLLADGGIATGTFTFDADAGTPCGSFGPCGSYSNVQIVTTTGSSRAGATYSSVCGENVPGCTGVSPDSTEVLFLASNTRNQTGDSALALFFAGIGVFPPYGLTDSGGTIDISSTSSAVGTLDEVTCANASYSLPSAPSRTSIAGTVSAVPEPASWLLLLGTIGILGPLMFMSRGLGDAKRE